MAKTNTPGEPLPEVELYSIKTVSELTGVDPQILRKWEQQLPGLLNPVRTAGGPKGRGQRRYTPADVERVREIGAWIYGRGVGLGTAGRMIAEGRDPTARSAREIADSVLRDGHVRQAIDEFAALVRKKIFRTFGEF